MTISIGIPNSSSKFIHRVAASAKLPISGSCKYRQEVGTVICQEYFKLLKNSLLNKKMEGKPEVVTLNEIKQFFAQIAPIKTLANVENARTGEVAPVYSDLNKSTIINQILKIPFSSLQGTIKKSDGPYFKILRHEICHYSINVVEPKYLVHCTKGILSDAQHEAQWGFFATNLYRGLKNPSSFFKSPDHNKLAKVTLVKDVIDKFFSGNVFSGEEKIDVLQKWRHYLKAELKAYNEEFSNAKDDLFFSDADENSLNSKRLLTLAEKSNKKELKRIIENEYFFAEKIEVVEKMLRDELKKERDSHAVFVQNLKNINVKLD